MWIEGDRLHLIDSALEQGRRHDIDRLLADILAPGAAERRIPTACPSCRRDLIRNTLPGAGLYVSASLAVNILVWWLPQVALGLLFMRTHRIEEPGMHRPPPPIARTAAHLKRPSYNHE